MNPAAPAGLEADKAPRAGWYGALLLRVRDLAALIFVLATLLFFLLRVAGDPAQSLGGIDATAEQLAAIRAAHGLDQPLWWQYLSYLGHLVRLDFGASMTSGQPALTVVAEHLPSTLLLAMLAILTSFILSLLIGVWLGAHPERGSRRIGRGVLFILQGIPGFVAGLLLVRLFAVKLAWLPSIGTGSAAALILPTLTLAAFLTPKLARVVATGVTAAMREDYIRTARANGARHDALLWRHALPNALLAVTAMLGAQFAALLSGAVVTEVIFARPGIGWLLLKATETLDFPVIQTLALVVALLVFVVNAFTDIIFLRLDPRLRNRTNVRHARR